MGLLTYVWVAVALLRLTSGFALRRLPLEMPFYYLQKISLRRQKSRLAARALHSAVTVDFPESSLCGIPSAYALLMP